MSMNIFLWVILFLTMAYILNGLTKNYQPNQCNRVIEKMYVNMILLVIG